MQSRNRLYSVSTYSKTFLLNHAKQLIDIIRIVNVICATYYCYFFAFYPFTTHLLSLLLGAITIHYLPTKDVTRAENANENTPATTPEKSKTTTTDTKDTSDQVSNHKEVNTPDTPFLRTSTEPFYYTSEEVQISGQDGTVQDTVH